MMGAGRKAREDNGDAGRRTAGGAAPLLEAGRDATAATGAAVVPSVPRETAARSGAGACTGETSSCSSSTAPPPAAVSKVIGDSGSGSGSCAAGATTGACRAPAAFSTSESPICRKDAAMPPSGDVAESRRVGGCVMQ